MSISPDQTGIKPTVFPPKKLDEKKPESAKSPFDEDPFEDLFDTPEPPQSPAKQPAYTPPVAQPTPAPAKQPAYTPPVAQPTPAPAKQPAYTPPVAQPAPTPVTQPVYTPPAAQPTPAPVKQPVYTPPVAQPAPMPVTQPVYTVPVQQPHYQPAFPINHHTGIQFNQPMAKPPVSQANTSSSAIVPTSNPGGLIDSDNVDKAMQMSGVVQNTVLQVATETKQIWGEFKSVSSQMDGSLVASITSFAQGVRDGMQSSRSYMNEALNDLNRLSRVSEALTVAAIQEISVSGLQNIDDIMEKFSRAGDTIRESKGKNVEAIVQNREKETESQIAANQKRMDSIVATTNHLAKINKAFMERALLQTKALIEAKELAIKSNLNIIREKWKLEKDGILAKMEVDLKSAETEAEKQKVKAEAESKVRVLNEKTKADQQKIKNDADIECKSKQADLAKKIEEQKMKLEEKKALDALKIEGEKIKLEDQRIQSEWNKYQAEYKEQLSHFRKLRRTFYFSPPKIITDSNGKKSVKPGYVTHR